MILCAVRHLNIKFEMENEVSSQNYSRLCRDLVDTPIVLK